MKGLSCVNWNIWMVLRNSALKNERKKESKNHFDVSEIYVGTWSVTV